MDRTKAPDCEFCKHLAKQKDDDAYYKANSQRARAKDVEIKYDISLNCKSFLDGHRTGQVTIGNFQLNFCPVCGKPMRK